MVTPEEIKQRSQALRAAGAAPQHARPPSGSGMAVRVAVELLAAVGVGVSVGYFMDDWLGTAPLFIIICMLLGMGAGFITIKRVNEAYAIQLEREEKNTSEGQ